VVLTLAVDSIVPLTHRARYTCRGIVLANHLEDREMGYRTGTKVTDDGLKELAQLKELTSLGLGETSITDKGLKEIAKFKGLTKLYLYSTKVTDAAVTELQEVLPKCEIKRKSNQ
jgi:hypothetical protein